MGLPMRMKAAIKSFIVLVSLVMTILLVIRFLEISAPQSALEYLSREISSEDWLVRADSVKWSFPGRVGIKEIGRAHV